MHLIVVHHHLRPGGVRRVIELALPALADHPSLQIRRVTLMVGEDSDPSWSAALRRRLTPSLDLRVEPALGYSSDHRFPPSTARERMRLALDSLLGRDPGEPRVVWVHNPGLGRNLLLVEALFRACEAHGATLLEHHHDWWFDNRWRHWREIRASGFRTLAQTARALFPDSPVIRHAAINRMDAAILRRHGTAPSGWLPNPVDPFPEPGPDAARRARRWLARELGEDAPVWLMAARLVRRKNVAEALLLARWLRPDAWLVTTGGASSADEQPYQRRLEEAARRHGWRLRIGVLAGREGPGAPRVPELMAASEALLLTSVQEGFGLTYLEAAAAGRPLLARRLPNVFPDLRRLGFRFPQAYDEVLVDPGLFDARAERSRQRRRFERWRRSLPSASRGWVEAPLVPDDMPVAYSRLTLEAQLEVLSRPLEESWARCAPLNPFLARWRRRAANGSLMVTRPGPAAWEALGGGAYASRFEELLRPRRAARKSNGARSAERLQEAFMRERLRRENLYPLLWDENA